MRISKEEVIAGHPAVAVRKLLRGLQGDEFCVEYVVEDLGLSNRDSVKLLEDLVSLGYLCHTGDSRWPYKATLAGGALSLAKLGRGFSRQVAEKALAAFLERVEALNSDDQYAFRVKTVILFGSMLSDKDPVNDVDLMFDLEARLANRDAQRALEQDRIRKAEDSGRALTGFLAYGWPWVEVQRFLKGRSPVLSLHGFDQITAFPNLRYRVLRGDRAAIAALVPGGEDLDTAAEGPGS